MATSLEVEAKIRGYHEYKDIWEAEITDKLKCQREMDNCYDIGNASNFLFGNNDGADRAQSPLVIIPWFPFQPRKL